MLWPLVVYLAARAVLRSVSYFLAGYNEHPALLMLRLAEVALCAYYAIEIGGLL